MFSIQTFGGFQIRRDGRFQPLELSSGPRKILYFLLLNPHQMVRRDKLIDTIFQEDISCNRSAVNTVFWRLKSGFKKTFCSSQLSLISDADSIMLEGPGLRCMDYVRLQEGIYAASLELDPYLGAELLELALAEYSGPLLDGEDEDWVLIERARLNSLYINGLENLMRLYFEQGNLQMAQSAGLRALGVEPGHEKVCRQMMLIYTANGQRAKALEQFEDCTRLLEKDFGLTPEHATRSLAEKIQVGDVYETFKELCVQEFLPTLM